MKRQVLVAVLLLLVINVPVAPVLADSISEVMARMTVEQRVGQLFIVRFWGSQASGAKPLIEQMHPGGVVVLKTNILNPMQVTQLINDTQQLAAQHDDVPLFVTLDQEGGRIQRLREGFTVLPPPLILGAITDEQVLQEYGRMMATELAAVGVNMNLAPSLDLATSPNNPVMRARMYGDDGKRVAMVTNAIIDGMEQQGVVGVAKHFPGHGDASDTHVDLAYLRYDMERLKAVEFSSFAASDAPVIMVAHIAVPALDPSELPATLSPTILRYLRQELGYQGVLITDAMDMGAILLHGDYAESALRSFEAGMDIILLGANVSNEEQIAAYQAILKAVKSGQVSEDRLNESVRRILELKQRFGLLQWSAQAVDQTTERIAASNSATVLDEVYRAAITVMRDETGMIPLPVGTKIGVIYSSQELDTPTLCRFAPTVETLRMNLVPRSSDVSQAAALAKRVDAVIVFTEDAEFTPEQQILVNALPPEKVIVVALRSPYDWRTFLQVAGYVLTYVPTQTSIRAACDVLFGRAKATGVLPVRIGVEYMAGESAD
ncbi:MAG: hypothetical protein KF726_18855 [Anaerolineae bacterium]|nr:hypothetical protein [Anaerolineae bacterium]